MTVMPVILANSVRVIILKQAANSRLCLYFLGCPDPCAVRAGCLILNTEQLYGEGGRPIRTLTVEGN